jgi:class 3 adenylate cyclase
VVFSELGSALPLAVHLDPEELRKIVQTYQTACSGVISRFAGHIARYMSEGLLVYFGYPQAHEDDAQRAVRAGLEILAGLSQLNTQLQGTVGLLREAPLQVRLGIHTGPVVVGEMGGGGDRDPMAIVGKTPNIAARLQGLATPNTVVISAATHRLTEGFFEYQELGPQKLKGVSTPVTVYRVLGASEPQGRFAPVVRRGLTPLVGRQREVELLVERWERVKEGDGWVVLLSGEAGIGKSRLVQVLKERVAGEVHTRLECYCSPYHQNSAFYPVIGLLERVLEFSSNDAPADKLHKLEGALERDGLARAEAVPLLAALLSLPLPERYAALTLTPQRQRQKTLETLLAWLLARAEHHPVLWVVEDLQWSDPSTLELLSLVIEQGPTARILTLLTFRPEFRPPWVLRSYLTQLTLSRLPRQQAEVLVDKVTRDKALPAEVRRQLADKTDGVPLFVEELTKMVLESGLLRDLGDRYELASPLPPLAIPVTLHDSLMARLDRLATAKETAQLGATLGREFSYDLLQAVSPLDEVTLQRDLARLAAAELVYQRGLPPQARYLFKHALIQEVAYQSLLKSTRQHSHQHIAQVVQARFPELVES